VGDPRGYGNIGTCNPIGLVEIFRLIHFARLNSIAFARYAPAKLNVSLSHTLAVFATQLKDHAVAHKLSN